MIAIKYAINVHIIVILLFIVIFIFEKYNDFIITQFSYMYSAEIVYFSSYLLA